MLLSISTLVLAAPLVATAQEPRLVGRLSEAVRPQVDNVLDSARAAGLPTEPIVDRALEGAAKGAPGNLIVVAVRRLWGELSTARQAFGDEASPSEITAGAGALRAGAAEADLTELRTLRPGQPLTIAAATLADLVAAGVPTDTAIGAVLALAGITDDAEYIAFRRNVERDIALGASPEASLGVRLAAAADATSPAAESGTLGTTSRGRRKP
jgi:hypothetical protein